MHEFDELSKKLFNTHNSICDLENDVKATYEELISLNISTFRKIQDIFVKYINYCPDLKRLTSYVDYFEMEITVSETPCLVHFYDSDFSFNYPLEKKNNDNEKEVSVCLFVDRRKSDDSKDIIEAVPLGVYTTPSISRYQSKFGYYDLNEFRLDEDHKTTKDILFVLKNVREINQRIENGLFVLGNDRLDKLNREMTMLNRLKKEIKTIF